MKIAIIAESFLPHMNGVTGSVLQVLKHFSRQGHELLVIAPDAGHIDADLYGARTRLVKSVPLPSYPEVRMVFVRPAKIAAMLREFGADIVHLASPFTLGWAGVRAANAVGIPCIAVYQTDVTAYAEKYGIPGGAPMVASHLTRLHRRATLTLVPSSSSHADCEALGIDRLRRWGRGVDADRFAPEHRNEAWHDSVAHGRHIIGYVGRLAPEKQVEDLKVLHDMPGVRLVIVGDGPSRASLEQLMPDAHFTGFLGGADLAEAMASFDVFVHPGEADTFGQTLQESLASGVPVVATGAGGPLDLVRSSIDGWLYTPGNLDEMRDRVADLLGDPAKRLAFSKAARLSVRNRTWSALCDQLLEHYAETISLHSVDQTLMSRGSLRPASMPTAAKLPAPTIPDWQRYIALGDSITEGLGDTSRMPEGEFLGWAARLAMLLSDHKKGGVQFANLAVRSRRVMHLDEQVTRALELEPDFVSVLMGANDLLLARVDIDAIAAELEHQVVRLRRAGIDVLLGTPFLPRRRAARVIAGRFAEFNSRIRRIAHAHECRLLDIEAIPEIADIDMWAEDRVHLVSAGHRLLAYHAAALLGVRDATTLGLLEHALHAGSPETPVATHAALQATSQAASRSVSRSTSQSASRAEAPAEVHDTGPANHHLTGPAWVRAHALPWAWRRVRGRTAGDGLNAKHDTYIELAPGTLPGITPDSTHPSQIGFSQQ